MIAVAEPGTRSLSDDEFVLFQKLVKRLSGISLGPQKKPLVLCRLGPRLRALGLRSFGEYYRRVTAAGGEGELVHMLDCICTNETHFFREREQFELLEREILPAWEKSAGPGSPDRGAPRARVRRPLRAWSAACSTGEEPYSIAMTLLDSLSSDHSGARADRAPRRAGGAPAGVPGIGVLATDLSVRALERARCAVWPIDRASEIPDGRLRAYMLRGTGASAGLMKAGPELRQIVTFRRFNLLDAAPERFGLFDLIFCRNVFIYFDAATKAEIVAKLIASLAPGGYLFLGHAEGLHGTDPRVRCVAPSVYRLQPPAGLKGSRIQ
ncbi:Methyl-accepting chemotaxis protein O-methyltransferase [Sorangium cellulosum So ce56]|uniref:protein-glutamate O-methyltransferase n=1 Tax=Sorangium cellulosum (strain So ce56) TaxID=448385 RepID=A9FWF6_SORC5|nr:CheR family methyltransferase [Sorangium cellulosum]CAN92374.1 Methyl-accepting chemotaxis protein O-methyltransferase [Sorangium cellulosum So ce56]